MSCIRSTAVIRLGTVWLAAALVLAGSASAQQFPDETSTRFPSPNPTEYTSQLTIGDLDGDNDLDIIFANGSGFGCPVSSQKARFYINDGTGVFTDESDARTGGYSGRHRGVELGDCDDDGDLDVLLVQDCNFLPGLLINNGSGFFTNEAGTRLPNVTLASSRGQFGDVDNDGDLDIFITSGTNSRFDCGQYRLYLNDGACNYSDATGVNFPSGNECNNMDCIFGDIDNDFDIDIKTASTGTNNSLLYRNDGSGTFTEVAGVPNDSSCYSYDFGDIDGDGDLDLLGANAVPGSSAELLLENDGSGGYSDVSSQITPNNSIDDNDSKFIDYDNDGDLDLLVGAIGGSDRTYRNNGSGTFVQTSNIVPTTNDSTLDVMVADLTGDGAYDIVTAQGESGNFQNRIYINTGPADTFAPTIVDTEQVTDPDDAGPYVVRSLILDQMTSDRNFFDKGISLIYSVDAGPDQTVAMKHSGGQVYRGEIPGQAGGSNVEYHVSATDWNNNVATGGTLSFLIPDCSGVNDCSGNGICTGVDVCECDPGWDGADCSTFVPASAGRVPAQGPDNPVRLQKTPSGSLRLFWDDSCGAEDIDYEVYQGSVGDFTSHQPLVCTTNDSKILTFTPDPGDLYFLVVPKSFNAEGSYGLESSGGQRPVGLSTCEPQSIAPCG